MATVILNSAIGTWKDIRFLGQRSCVISLVACKLTPLNMLTNAHCQRDKTPSIHKLEFWLHGKFKTSLLINLYLHVFNHIPSSRDLNSWDCLFCSILPPPVPTNYSMGVVQDIIQSYLKYRLSKLAFLTNKVLSAIKHVPNATETILWWKSFFWFFGDKK